MSTEAEPRWTMLFEGLRSTMSSRKEYDIYFIVPNFPISYTVSSNYFPHRVTYSINGIRCFDFAKNNATAAIDVCS